MSEEMDESKGGLWLAYRGEKGSIVRVHVKAPGIDYATVDFTEYLKPYVALFKRPMKRATKMLEKDTR